MCRRSDYDMAPATFGYCPHHEISIHLQSSKLKASQKDKLKQFMQFTRAGERIGLQLLSTYDWKVDLAIDKYFQSPERFSSPGNSASHGRSQIDKKKLDSLFLHYKGSIYSYTYSYS